jgi:EF hand
LIDRQEKKGRRRAMRTASWFKALVAGTIVAGWCAQAAPAQSLGAGASGERLAAVRQKLQEWLQHVDTDGDGAISRAEYAAQSDARFNRVDANGDGKVTEEELDAALAGLRQRRNGGLGGDVFP